MTDATAPGTARMLRAGPLTLVYENGSLRWIRFGGHEILRGIYVGVRDEYWRTIPPAIGELTIDAREDTFRINLTADHRHLDLDFHWRGTIVGDRNGGLAFTMDGVAQRTFRKNRIGLCVLHPMADCSGRPCTVEHVDGHITSASFPTLVSPHQAFRQVRALAHEVVPGVIAEVRVEGDVFETEDQRNWSDTSFKTYSTPVDLPFPVEVAAGTRVRQEVRLRLRGPIHVRGNAESADAVRLEATATRCEIPRLGLMIDATQSLSADEATRLRAIGLSHLRVDLDLAAPESEWQQALQQADRQAAALEASLQVAALVPDANPREALTALAEAAVGTTAGTLRVPIDAWLVFDRRTGTTPESLLTIAREVLTAFGPGRIGGGSNVHFADLNRNRPPAALLDLLVYPMSPQAHATDVETMVENLGSIASVRQTARSFAAARPVAISPVTLKPRFKTGAPVPPPLDAWPDDIDPRQTRRFAAAWTISHLRAAAEAGVESVTYFRTVGADGLMARDGEVFPVYQALADIGACAGGHALILRSSDPQRVDALCLERHGRWRLLLVNLRAEPQRVHLPPMRDAHGATAPLDLDGHAIVRLDFETPTKKGDSVSESPFI
jgi:D-apionolactonase